MTETEILNGVRYTAPMEDRGYTPPIPPEPFEPPKVTAHAVKADGTVLEQAHQAMIHARETFQKHLDETNANRHLYTAEGYADQVARFKETSAAKAVDRAEAEVTTRRDQAQADVDRIRQSLVQPGDSAQESRNTRFWLRTKDVLDTMQSGQLFSEAEQLLNKADRSQIGVLLEELPAYLRVKAGPLPESTKLKLGLPKDADWGDWISNVYLPGAVPEYAAARDKLTKATAALQFTTSTAQILRRSFDTGTTPSAQVLDKLNPHTAGRLATDLRGTLPKTNGGRYDPDAA